MDNTMASKYVRIDPRFRLRGWQGRPYALADTLTATAHFMTKGIFDTLMLCNGRFRPKDPVFLGARRDHLELAQREGVLAFSKEPSSLEPEQEYRLYPNHHMRQVQWSITGRCNYRCRHCFMGAPHAALPQPSTEECLAIVDQMAEAGVLVVKLTGGEPLVHPGFLEIVGRLCERGIPIATILTNGALLDEGLLGFLEERGLTPGFDVSFDGIGWHDWLRGVGGAHESVTRALALCRERGFATGAELVLHKGNIGALRESVNALGRLGHHRRRGVRGLPRLRPPLPGGRDAGPPASCSPTSSWPLLAPPGPGRAAHRGRGLRALPVCASARATMYLGPDGRTLPCIPLSETEAASGSIPYVLGKRSLAQFHVFAGRHAFSLLILTHS